MTRRSSMTQAVAQPLGGIPLRVRRDWTARTRDTALNALHYSRFVAVMKRALPITAGAIIAVVVVYSLVPRQSDRISLAYERMGKIDNDLAMLKPRLTGSDRKGNPFVITADAAIQDPHNFRRATLKKVVADLTLDKARWLNANATHGFVDLEKSTLTLTQGISIFSDDGYELHTTRANVDLRSGTFKGPDAVTGQGPAGTLRADRFEVDRNTSQLMLIGHVRMTIVPSQVRRK